MKHDFLDHYSELDSPLHRLDPRAKLIAFFAAIFIIVSEVRGELGGFVFYAGLTLILVSLSNVPTRFILKRCLMATPFILMAAMFVPVSFLLDSAPGLNTEAVVQFTVSILLKAYLAILLLTLLTSTERFNRLLWGLRRLRMPKVFCVLSSLLYRHMFILLDEIHRTTRARESRTPGKIRQSRLKTFGNQVAVIFLRAWERAEKVNSAMLSRGFTGEFPQAQKQSFRALDLAVMIIITGLFLAVRLRGYLPV